MSSRPGPKLTYANVMSSIAVFLVLGGGAAFAASKLGKNTVGTKQLKKNAVTTVKIKNGAVNGAKVANGSLAINDLSPSVFNGYAKTSDLNGYLKGSDSIPGGDLTGSYGSPQLRNGAVGPDKLGSLPTASLYHGIYNVGGGEGIDCMGSDAEFPDNFTDDIDFEAVGFDSGGLVNQPESGNPNCFNGFRVSRAGTYMITAWIGWGANEVGDREINLIAANPGGACCGISAYGEQPANDTESGAAVTAQTISGIARLQPNGFVRIAGRQSSGAPLALFGGDIQIAWIGP